MSLGEIIAYLSTDDLKHALKEFPRDRLTLALYNQPSSTLNIFFEVMTSELKEMLKEDIDDTRTVGGFEFHKTLEAEMQFINLLIDLHRKGEIAVKAFERLC